MTLFTVTAQFEDRDGAPAVGRVFFAPIVERALDGTVIVLGDKVAVHLDATGAIAQELVVDVNGYTFTARIKGAPIWQGEIPGNADIDLMAAPQPAASPPGIARFLPDLTYQVGAIDQDCFNFMVGDGTDTEIVVAFPDDATDNIPAGSNGNFFQTGTGQIRAAAIGSAVLHYPDDDTVTQFKTRVLNAPLSWVKGRANEYWLTGDMEYPS